MHDVRSRSIDLPEGSKKGTRKGKKKRKQLSTNVKIRNKALQKMKTCTKRKRKKKRVRRDRGHGVACVVKRCGDGVVQCPTSNIRPGENWRIFGNQGKEAPAPGC